MPGKKKDKVQAAKKKALVQSFQQGCTIPVACKGADISVSTFWRWTQNDLAFKNRVDGARIARVQVVEDALYENALHGGQQGKGVVAAQIFFLCNKAPDKWKNVQNIDVSHRIDKLPLKDLMNKLPRGQRRFADLGFEEEQN